MDSSEDLERRVAAVESEVAVARREAAAARALAAGADRDVADYRAEMRAHTRGLNALRLTQLEQYAELQQTQLEHYAEHKADVADLKAVINTDVAELKALINTASAKLTTGMTHIVQLLESPEGRSDSRDG